MSVGGSYTNDDDNDAPNMKEQTFINPTVSNTRNNSLLTFQAYLIIISMFELSLSDLTFWHFGRSLSRITSSS